MTKNVFEELQTKKQMLATLAQRANAYGWITNEQRQEITTKLDSDVLTIGVIGQMKCGKSTFLNAFVFEDDVLPATTTPMTAALSIITYGEKKKVEAEFYTADEWKEQELTASRSLEEVQNNPLELSKVKAAKEMIEKSSKLGATLQSYLGKTQEDDYANLIEYVGADGKYVSITKAVKIYYPKDYLKGVEIVDTPGFNDPIVSREERTKDFLRRADVVLMMLYAGRPFDATDREILFKNVRVCGIGKVIIGINKYDLPYHNGEKEEEIKNYVKEEINKACKACNDTSLVELLRQAEPIPLSAEMALLSELPMSKIDSNEAYKDRWGSLCTDFEISSQSEIREKSHLDLLASAVKQMIANEKEKILFAKPLNAIKSAGIERQAKIEKLLFGNKNYISDLSKPEEELDEKYNNLERAEKRLNKKIGFLEDDLDALFKQIISKGVEDLEDQVDTGVKKMTNIVEDVGRFKNFENIEPKLRDELDTLVNRTLKRSAKRISDDAKIELKKIVRDFANESEEVLMKYLPDFEGEDFVKEINKQIQIEIDEEVFELGDGEENEESWLESLLSAGWEFLRGASWGILDGFSAIGNAIEHNKTKQEYLEKVSNIKHDIDVRMCLEHIVIGKDEIIEKVHELCITELITPIKEQIDDIRSSKESKEEQLRKAKEENAKLLSQKSEIEQQMAEIEKQSAEIG